MRDIYVALRKEAKNLTIGASTSRAYDNAVRRAKAAGVPLDQAKAFGNMHYAKATELYAKLTSK